MPSSGSPSEVTVFQSNYVPHKLTKPYPTDYVARIAWTEKEREKASQAVIPGSWKEYCTAVGLEKISLPHLTDLVCSFKNA